VSGISSAYRGLEIWRSWVSSPLMTNVLRGSVAEDLARVKMENGKPMRMRP
jgi:hypothetical protein